MSRSPARIAALFPYELWLSGELNAGIDQYATSEGIPIHPLLLRNLSSLQQQKWVKGIIAFGSGHNAINSLNETGLPVVNVSGYFPTVPFPSVLNDSQRMGRLAAQHMIECGASRLVYASVTAKQTGFLLERQKGVQDICHSAGVELNYCMPRLMKTRDVVESQEHWAEAVLEWIQNQTPPLAFITANPFTTEAILMATDQMGWEVGGEVSLIQLTDPEEERMPHSLGVSYIANDWRTVGRLAAESLHLWMEQGTPPPPLQLVPPLPPVLTASSDPSRDASLVVRVRSYLKHSQDYGVTIEEVAARMGVSISTLYRQFQREAGHSLKQELLERRLSHACDLLRTTTMSVADIAARCGYATGHSFAASFRSQYTMPPATWRNVKT